MGTSAWARMIAAMRHVCQREWEVYYSEDSVGDNARRLTGAEVVKSNDSVLNHALVCDASA